MDKELLEELNEMIDNGCSMVEVFEYIEDNTDEDPTLYIMALMQKGRHEMIKRLLSDLRKWSEFDRELEVNKDKDITQDMCDRYCKITETALEALRQYDKDKYNWYGLNGTIGNEIELFADAIECYLQ